MSELCYQQYITLSACSLLPSIAARRTQPSDECFTQREIELAVSLAADVSKESLRQLIENHTAVSS